MAAADPRSRFLAAVNEGPIQRSTYRLESAWTLGNSGRGLLLRNGSSAASDLARADRVAGEYTKEGRAYRYIPQELASDAFLNLQHLNLSRNKLKEIAPRVFQFSQLRTLILANNEIMRLSSVIEKLANLEYLSLAGNYIEQLPAELYCLTALTHLDLSANKIRTVRPGIRALAKVRVIRSSPF
jgi:Leucine-rich repeat (LRR) protein